MGLFILVGTISKMLNRRLERKLEALEKHRVQKENHSTVHPMAQTPVDSVRKIG